MRFRRIIIDGKTGFFFVNQYKNNMLKLVEFIDNNALLEEVRKNKVVCKTNLIQ